MEEKWWSKFQNRTTENKEEVVNNDVETKTDSETFDNAISFIQDLSDKIESNVDTELASENASIASEVQARANEFVNSPEVREAAEKAHEIMDNVISEVASWTDGDTSEPREENPILHDFDNVKDAVSEALSSKPVQDAYDTIKTGFEDVSEKVKEVWERPEVQDKYEQVKDFVYDQLEKEPVRDTLDFVMDKADDAKSWAFEIYSRDNVQEGVAKIKETSSDVIESTKSGFNKVINNPNVKNSYTIVKENTVKAGKTIKTGVVNTVEDVKNSESFKQELSNWKDSAWTFTKQSGRVIAATAIEIKNNENVQKAVKGTGKFLRDTAERAITSASNWWNKKHGVQFLEYKDEENKEG